MGPLFGSNIHTHHKDMKIDDSIEIEMMGTSKRKRNRAQQEEEDQKPAFEMKRKSAVAVTKAPRKNINGDNKGVLKGGFGSGGIGKMNKKTKKGFVDEKEKEVMEERNRGEKKQRVLVNGDFGTNHDNHESWSNGGGEKWGMEVLMGSNWDYELFPSSYWCSSVVDEQMLWAGSIWFPVCKEVEEENGELMINEVVWEDDLWHLKDIKEIPVSPNINNKSNY